MNVLLLLVPAALALGLMGLAAFLWTLRHRQYEDLDGAAARILFDDIPRATRDDIPRATRDTLPPRKDQKP